MDPTKVMAMNPPPRPSQIDEDDDNPLFTTTIEPLTREHFSYTGEDELYRFRTPYNTIALKVSIPHGPGHHPKHPDRIPPPISAFWHIVCNVERLALGTPLTCVPLNDTLLGYLDVFWKYLASREKFLDYGLPSSWAVLMGKAFEHLALPVRRRLPQLETRLLEGGRAGWKGVRVYPWYDSMDILKREAGLICSGGINHNNLVMSMAPVAPSDHFNQAHEKYCTSAMVLTNAARRGRPTRLFPNHRQDVIDFYSKPHNRIQTDVDVGPRKQRIFDMQIGDAFLSSSARLEDLRRIELDEMRCHQQHEGRYLLCRVITAPRIGLGIAFAVEDPNGLAVAVAVHHTDEREAFSYSLSHHAERFPVGAMLAVKEPCVSLGRTTGIAEVRVSSPADIERIPASDVVWRFDSPSDLTRTVAEIRELGTAALLAGKYEKAKALYREGLKAPKTDLAPSDEIALRLNLALTFLGLGQPGPALAECLRLEKLDGLTDTQLQKLYHRKLQAACKLQLWNTAEEALSQCKDAKLDRAKWSSYEMDLKERKQQSRGVYDWLSLIRKTKAKEHCLISDYIGPIDVRTVPTRGRGMFVTRDVRAGELLLVERAIVTSHRNSNGIVQITDPTDPALPRLSAHTAGWCIQAIAADPSKLLALNALMPGDTRESPIATEEERLAAITSPVGPINVDDLHRKEVANAFGTPETGNLLFGCCSILNHSCLPTAKHMSFEGAEIIWALNDLPAGTELTFSYVDTRRFYASRTNSFRTVWQFKCDCQSCLDDGKDQDAERERLMREEWPKIAAIEDDHRPDDSVIDGGRDALLRGDMLEVLRMGSSAHTQSQLASTVKNNRLRVAFCDKLEATYAKGRKTPKWALATVYAATKESFQAGYPRGCESPAEGYEELLRVQGAVLFSPAEKRKTGRAIKGLPTDISLEDTIQPMMRIAMLMAMLGERAVAKIWLDTAFWAYKVMWGPLGFELGFCREPSFSMEWETLRNHGFKL